MPRTKGSRNKKLVGDQVPSSNFKSMEIIETKTQIFKAAISKKDIEEILFKGVKMRANFYPEQLFEQQEIKYDKKGNAFVTLINPTSLPKEINKIRNEQSKDTSIESKA